ncbi:MAG: hypothetical protein ACJ77N_06015 [Chloroflexota bacterium]
MTRLRLAALVASALLAAPIATVPTLAADEAGQPAAVTAASGTVVESTAAAPASPATLVSTAGPVTAQAAAVVRSPFRIDLARPGDFVAQTNLVQCVGASMQMMLNMIEPTNDRSARTQLRLQTLARQWSGPAPTGRVRKGASVRGWASGLTLLGHPYMLAGEDSLDAALRTAARAIRETGRPVGLLMWRGRHAWVMSGFTATADPSQFDDFRVTRAIVQDPLYPYGSRVWGPSPRPGTALTPEVLGQDYRRRRTGSTAAVWAGGSTLSWLAGKYVLVLPFEPQPSTVRTTRVL